MKYPDRTVAAARALHRLDIGGTLIGKLLNVPKESVSAWIHQNWRSDVAADEAMYQAIRTAIAPGVFSETGQEEPNPAEMPTCQPEDPAETPECQLTASVICKPIDIQTRVSTPVTRRVVRGSRY